MYFCTARPSISAFMQRQPFGSEGDDANIANADLFRVPPSLVPCADDDDGQIDKQLVN